MGAQIPLFAKHVLAEGIAKKGMRSLSLCPFPNPKATLGFARALLHSNPPPPPSRNHPPVPVDSKLVSVAYGHLEFATFSHREPPSTFTSTHLTNSISLFFSPPPRATLFRSLSPTGPSTT